jgi:hypothetical protein
MTGKTLKVASIVAASVAGLATYSSWLVHSALPSAIESERTSHPERAWRARVERKGPPHTFDLASQDPVQPHQTISLAATLPKGWAVTQAPKLVPDPATAVAVPTFQLVTSGTMTDPSGQVKYSVTVTNTGAAPMRFMADVPCSGCP